MNATDQNATNEPISYLAYHGRPWAPVLVAVLGCITAIISPVVVGALVATGRSASVAGFYLFMELGGCFAGALSAIPLSHRWSWRRIATVGFVGFAVTSALSVWLLPSPSLVVIRGVAGLSAGLSYGAGYALAGRSAQPTRDFARMVLLQLIITAVSVYVIPAINTPNGAALMFSVTGALGLIGAVAARWLSPLRLVPARQSPGAAICNRACQLSVSVVFLNFCAYGAVWAYAEPLGFRSAATPNFLAIALAVSAICGGIGALSAERASIRMAPGVPLSCSFLLGVIAFAALGFRAGPWTFAAAISAFQLSWTSGIPFMLGLVSTRSTESVLVAASAVELAGVAVGPGLAALVIDRVGVSAVVALGGVFLLAYVIALWKLVNIQPHTAAT